MPGPDATCHVCGSEIEPEHFESGEAITLFRRDYCGRCKRAAIERSREASSSPDFRTPRPGALQV